MGRFIVHCSQTYSLQEGHSNHIYHAMPVSIYLLSKNCPETISRCLLTLKWRMGTHLTYVNKIVHQMHPIKQGLVCANYLNLNCKVIWPNVLQWLLKRHLPLKDMIISQNNKPRCDPELIIECRNIVFTWDHSSL